MRRLLEATAVLAYGLSVALLVALALARPRLDAFYPVALVAAVALTALVLAVVTFPFVLSTDRRPLGVGLTALVMVLLAFAVSLR